MGIEQWWSRLDRPTRLWLVEHNGEPLTQEIVEKIREAGGTVEMAEPDGGTARAHLSDEDVDRVEAWANEE